VEGVNSYAMKYKHTNFDHDYHGQKE